MARFIYWYAECHYVECRGAPKTTYDLTIIFLVGVPYHKSETVLFELLLIVAKAPSSKNIVGRIFDSIADPIS